MENTNENKSALQTIKDNFDLTPNKDTSILLIKGANIRDILDVMDKHGFHPVGSYRGGAKL